MYGKYNIILFENNKKKKLIKKYNTLENSIKTPKKPASKNYFTQETEDAIVLYNSTTDFILKSKIYEEKIHYAFF